jgi:hypothetical protein
MQLAKLPLAQSHMMAYTTLHHVSASDQHKLQMFVGT